MLYPEAQKKAQDELDTVLGTSSKNEVLRLPTFDEWVEHIPCSNWYSTDAIFICCSQTQLPYINALVKEVLRWHISECYVFESVEFDLSS